MGLRIAGLPTAARFAPFDRRGSGQPTDPWHRQARWIVDAAGGDELLLNDHDALDELRGDRPATHVVRSVAGNADATYWAVLDVLAASRQ